MEVRKSESVGQVEIHGYQKFSFSSSSAHSPRSSVILARRRSSSAIASAR